MQAATVRELKNHTSELLCRAAREDVMITSRGQPVACLIGLHPDDVLIQRRGRRADYADEKYRQRVFRLLERIWKLKPDKGKQWVSQEHHGRRPIREPAE